jgi:DNA polymerase-3 subunit alpha
MVMLRKEKEVNGMYLSSHPLDEFKHEIDFFTNNSLAELGNMERLKGHEMTFGAIVTDVNHRIAKNGNGWGLV